MSDANSATQRPIGLKLRLQPGKRMIQLGSEFHPPSPSGL